jgi:hypothetical protein
MKTTIKRVATHVGKGAVRIAPAAGSLLRSSFVIASVALNRTAPT